MKDKNAVTSKSHVPLSIVLFSEDIARSIPISGIIAGGVVSFSLQKPTWVD